MCVSVSTALMVRPGFGGYISDKAYRECRGHYILYYPGFRIRGSKLDELDFQYLKLKLGYGPHLRASGVYGDGRRRDGVYGLGFWVTETHGGSRM